MQIALNKTFKTYQRPPIKTCNLTFGELTLLECNSLSEDIQGVGSI
jgi:hypothetical protein